MSKDKKPKANTHRPLLPTGAAIDNIKQQFVNHQSDKVVVQGADYKKTEQVVPEEQLARERANIPFFPFPESGNICEWVSNPTRPGVFVVVVNIEPDSTKEPKPGFFATTRQPETAQMICDGINFLFKCQKQMEQVGAPEQVQPTVFAPVVLPDKVDSNSPPAIPSE